MTLTEVFQTIDEDGSGEIDVSEFRAGMISLGVSFTDEEITALMEQVQFCLAFTSLYITFSYVFFVFGLTWVTK